MLFEPHEKAIYVPEGWTGEPFDPLALYDALVIATDGRLDQLLVAWQATSDGRGDISEEGRRQAAVMSAEAELVLAGAARVVFGLEPFPASTVGQSLELLDDFWRWLEGKGERAVSRQERPALSQEV